MNNPILRFLTIQILILIHTLTAVSSSFAQDPYQRNVRKIDVDELNLQQLSGLAFSPRANAFLSIASPDSANNVITLINLRGHVAGSAKIGTSITDPLNISYHSIKNSLLYFDVHLEELVEIKIEAESRLLSSIDAITRFQLQQFGFKHIQGIAVDPDKGDLYLLDTQIPRIVRITPDSKGRFDSHSVQTDGKITNIILNTLQGIELRGIAFNQLDGHLFVVSPSEQLLYEVNDQGEILTKRNLSLLEMNNTQSLVFAPSSDQTDDPDKTNLYILDSGLRLGQAGITELSLVQPEQLDLSDITVKISSFRVRSMNPARNNFKSSSAGPSDPSPLDHIPFNTVYTSLWSPPSPDPSGVAYIPPSNSLLVCDGEVEEVEIFAGVNVYESSFPGLLLSTESTMAFSDEPTGVAYNPDNQHLYFSDDSGDRWVFELNPGPDGLPWTLDDIVTSFVTDDFGSHDPEGIAYNIYNGHLFIADGENTEVYEVDPGNNGIFDGVPPSGDDVVSQFDTAVLGLRDPEGVEFISYNSNLYIVSGSDDIIVETTTAGTPVRVFLRLD
jgi:uncharacterized protein YjiK